MCCALADAEGASLCSRLEPLERGAFVREDGDDLEILGVERVVVLCVGDRRLEQLAPVAGNRAGRVRENRAGLIDRLLANVVAHQSGLAGRRADVLRLRANGQLLVAATRTSLAATRGPVERLVRRFYSRFSLRGLVGLRGSLCVSGLGLGGRGLLGSGLLGSSRLGGSLRSRFDLRLFRSRGFVSHESYRTFPVPAWPLKVRVGANSPSLCPTIASLTNTGTCLRPSCTAIVWPTISGKIVDARDQVLTMVRWLAWFMASMRDISRSSTHGPFLLLRDIYLRLPFPRRRPRTM